MSKEDILSKLSRKFQSVPQSEEDIIFALSRVRKIIEAENHPPEYSILNFYCNLALHTKIDKRIPKDLADELIRVHENLEYTHPFFGYPDLHNQMQGFMKKHNLPNFYENEDFNGIAFTKLLNSIYSDTPVVIQLVKEYRVSVDEDGIITGSFS